MKCFSEGTGFELDHVVNGYPWGDLEQGTVVDVGVVEHGILCFLS
jgi:hypothetical protein